MRKPSPCEPLWQVHAGDAGVGWALAGRSIASNSTSPGLPTRGVPPANRFIARQSLSLSRSADGFSIWWRIMAHCRDFHPGLEWRRPWRGGTRVRGGGLVSALGRLAGGAEAVGGREGRRSGKIATPSRARRISRAGPAVRSASLDARFLGSAMRPAAPCLLGSRPSPYRPRGPVATPPAHKRKTLLISRLLQ